ncbi:hypothetical protein E4T56_gene7718, partial [Termitomyces sp. T112]
MPWPGGHFNISSTWLHARYGTAALPVNPFVGGGVTLTGRQIQNSPNFAGNIGLEQDFATPLGKATLGVRTRISSSYYATTEQELPGAFQSSYHRTDLTAVLEPMHNLTLGLAVRNLENEAQTTGVYPAWRRFRAVGLPAQNIRRVVMKERYSLLAGLASMLCAASAQAAEKNACGQIVSATMQTQRLADIHEINNVASAHEYYHSAWLHKDE